MVLCMQNNDPGDLACDLEIDGADDVFRCAAAREIGASITGFTLASTNFIRDWRA